MVDLSRVLIIGGSGMLGSQCSFGIRPTHRELEITDVDSIARNFEIHKPEAVVHLAGIVDIKTAEENPIETERINVFGSANVADACARAGIPVVYVSSGMVFDGKKTTPYDESDTPNPQNVYGVTKYKGEQEVLKRAPRALVVRTGWLFGGLEHDKKFIHRFYDLLKANRVIRAINDRYGSPTYIPDFLLEVIGLLQGGATGVTHVVNSGLVSYFDVAQRLKILTSSTADVISSLASEIEPHGVKRGSMEGLVSNRGILLRSYEEPLAEYVSSLDLMSAGIDR